MLFIVESEETPADLSLPIVFKAPKSSKSQGTENKAKRPSTSSDHKKSKKSKTKALLSFDEEDVE